MTIKYHKRLHAKLYANDFDTLITSMNLHSYSMNENIEVGILLQMNLLRDIGSALSSFIGNSLENQARGFAEFYLSSRRVKYISKKRAKKQKSFFGLMLTYEAPEVIREKQRCGYCIRTAKPIAT